MARPRTVSAARDVLAELFPVRALQREHRVDMAITDDGRPDVRRAYGLLAPESRPTVDAEQVFPDGFDADDLQELLDTNIALITTLASLGFLTKAAEATLTNEFALGSLATGLLKNTTTTGVPSIAVANTDYLPVTNPAANGNINLGNAATDIIRNQGHMKHAGTVSSIAAGASLGTGGSVGATIAGTGSVGELTVTAGTTSLVSGTAATITFATARPDTNYTVQLTPRGVSAGANAVGAYATRNTVNDWLLRFSTAPTSGLTYSYSFFIFEWA